MADSWSRLPSDSVGSERTAPKRIVDAAYNEFRDVLNQTNRYLVWESSRAIDLHGRFAAATPKGELGLRNEKAKRKIRVLVSAGSDKNERCRVLLVFSCNLVGALRGSSAVLQMFSYNLVGASWLVRCSFNVLVQSRRRAWWLVPCSSSVLAQSRRRVSWLVPGSRFQVPGSRFRVPGSRFPGAGSTFHVPGSRFQVPGSRFEVAGFRFPVPGARLQVPGCRFQVQVPGPRL